MRAMSSMPVASVSDDDPTFTTSLRAPAISARAPVATDAARSLIVVAPQALDRLPRVLLGRPLGRLGRMVLGILHPAALGGRTLRDLAWHITLTLTELPGNAGLSVEGPQEGQPAPQSAQEIAAAYHQAANSVGEQVKAHWSDETLPEKVQMYGQDWTKGYSLNALIDHQAHHRGQMTVLMRQAGLKVPGVYGPSKEEWEAMGVPALP